MGTSLRNFDRPSLGRTLLRGAVVTLPPHDVDFYNTATALNLLTATDWTAFPNPTLGLFRSPGTLACNLNVQLTTAGGFTSSFEFQIQVIGFDENLDPQTHVHVCRGNGSATQNFSVQNLFANVTAINYRVSLGSFSGLGAVSAVIGIGDGAGSPADILLQNPFPRMPSLTSSIHPNIALHLTGNSMSAAAQYVTVNGGLVLPVGDGRFRAMRITGAYAATVNGRPAVILTYGMNADAAD